MRNKTGQIVVQCLLPRASGFGAHEETVAHRGTVAHRVTSPGVAGMNGSLCTAMPCRAAAADSQNKVKASQ